MAQKQKRLLIPLQLTASLGNDRATKMISIYAVWCGSSNLLIYYHNVPIKLCLLIVAHTTAKEAIDLSGEWDAVIIRMREEVGESSDAEKDIVKISQNGNDFVGTCIIGGKRIGKNKEVVKGKLSGNKFEEIVTGYPHEQITFKLLIRLLCNPYLAT